MSKTEADFRAEAIEDGEDFDVLATRGRTTILDAAARAKRQALIDARTQIDSVTDLRVAHPCPPASRIRKMLEELTKSDPQFAVNFRSGKTLTENDLISLYRQLVELGKVQPFPHED